MLTSKAMLLQHNMSTMPAYSPYYAYAPAACTMAASNPRRASPSKLATVAPCSVTSCTTTGLYGSVNVSAAS
eukprot:5252993-Pyramimonas_sp.AAC.1